MSSNIRQPNAKNKSIARKQKIIFRVTSFQNSQKTGMSSRERMNAMIFRGRPIFT
jgi:hypothetical protein